jgi:hypothetical protein
MSSAVKPSCHHCNHLDYDSSHTNRTTDFLMPEIITRSQNEKIRSLSPLLFQFSISTAQRQKVI